MKNSLFFFRKSKNFKAFRKGFVGSLIDGSFKKLDDTDTLLATDETIDFVLDDEDVYIFQHLSFERVFDLNSELSEKLRGLMKEGKDNARKNFQINYIYFGLYTYFYNDFFGKFEKFF